jgi:hypothetical protein
MFLAVVYLNYDTNDTVSLDKIIFGKALLVDLKDLLALGLHLAQEELIVPHKVFGFAL